MTSTAGPKILTVDLESSPNLVDVWGLWNQNVSLSQIRSATSVICFAAKWYDEEEVQFYSDFHDGHKTMVKKAHKLFDEADIVVSYNGVNFDVKHFQREFVMANLNPPSPFKNVDLLKVVKSQFRFSSNKLQHVAEQLNIGQKVEHSGHELWVKCLEKDPEAWALMKEYNIQDVVLTEDLYNRLGSWIKDHPSYALFGGEENCCPRCGGVNLQRRGLARTTSSSYQRFQCKDCGHWSRGNGIKSKTVIKSIK